jgi:nicotinamide-nucleotide amidase
MQQYVTCSIITIGDELLIGQTIDTNSAWIAQQLNPIGIQIKRRVAVGDVKTEIWQSLSQEIELSDIVIITGGLGPTADDITKPLLAEFFETELVMNEKVLQHVESFFAKRNRIMLESNRNQALVPSNCEVLFNEYGTAPGMLFRKNDKMIFSLPGVPFEMKYLMTASVIPSLQANCKTTNFIHRTLVTGGEGESFVAERLKDFEARLPAEIKLAYLPKLGILKLRLTGQNIEEPILEKYFLELQDILRNILIATEDIEIEAQIGKLLLASTATLSVAESCTGGGISALLTSVKGASVYFKGGFVVYQNETKIKTLGISKLSLEQHGAVSESTAIAMAMQCREKCKTDFALSITGYLEKGENENEIWIGLSSANQNFAYKINTPYDREKNTILASNTALNLLRKFILNQ